MKFDRIGLKITFLILISGLVLISNVAISQTAPTVTSWAQSTAYSIPGTYEEIEISDAEKKKFTVTLMGTNLHLVKLKFELTVGGGPTGTIIKDPELSDENKKAVYEVDAADGYTGARYKYVPYNGICPGETAEDGLCWGEGTLVAGPGKHTLSATLDDDNPATTVSDGVSTNASWNFWIVDTGTPNPPVTQQPPVRTNPPVTQQPPQQQPVQQNNAPAFTDSSTTTRSVAENTASDTNIGSPVAATDADDDTLTYTLGGTDAASFSIVSTTGQLRTSAALDYETKNSYTVTISVSDGNGGTDSITVTINVTDVTENSAPVFTDGDSTARSVAENTASGTNIGSPVAATDADDDTLTYTLGGTDAALFSIVDTSGQLRTSAALDYETKTSYSVTVTVSDSSISASITVTINITDVDEIVVQQPPPSSGEGTPQPPPPPVPQNNAPVFTDGASTTRSISENTGSGASIGAAVSATDADNDSLTYTLSGTDAASFSIVSTTGQLRTSAALDYETKTSYSVTVTVSDSSTSASITVTINITDVDETVVQQPPPSSGEGTPQPPPPSVPQNNAPVFTDGASTTRSISENTGSGASIGSAVSATDLDNNSLTYTLSGTDAALFSIVSTTGQLQTRAALDYETKTSYSVTVSVSDVYGGSASISITINVIDVDETEDQQQEEQVTTPTNNQDSEADGILSKPETPVNHTVKPFDYEAEGVGKVVFSEWMLSRLNNMPQWIELYNTTNEDINLRGWQIVGRFIDGNDDIHIFKSHTINSLTVKAKESYLIVAYLASGHGGSASENLQGNVYSLRSTRRLWSGKGIVLELQDSRGNPIDRIGNMNEQDEVKWNIPWRTRSNVNRERRISLIRRLKSVKSRKYNFRLGTTKFGWFPADEVKKLTESKRSEYFYGSSTDIGAPGYRTEGADPLPVTLSSFIPQATDGQVVLSWTTASEIGNAGFNVLRSESVAGSFTKINARLIQGAGTTSDRNEYTWIDTTAKPNIEYYYRIEDMSFDGISEVVATQRLKGLFTAKNRSLTRWAILKKATE